MGFHIYVHRKSDGACIYDNPLGSARSLSLRWHQPAQRLGLRVIGKFGDCDNAVEIEGDDLDVLSQELDVLEEFWEEVFIRSGPLKYSTVDLDRVWLREESDDQVERLREAIRLANDRDGVIVIH